MKFLRMRPEYIALSIAGKKTATTRTKYKVCSEFELITGSYFKPIYSNVRIRINEVVVWSQLNITPNMKERILKAENFKTWDLFMAKLEELNRRLFPLNFTFYTHFYEVIK